MTYDDWKTTPPDDDPDGTAYDHDDSRCPSCGALSDEDCAPECECRRCLAQRDPDVFCLRHGKPLVTKCASYCEDCEPPEPDGEAFRGGEAAAFEREQQAEILRTLK